MAEEKPVFDLQKYGFTEFGELLNFAQDKQWCGWSRMRKRDCWSSSARNFIRLQCLKATKPREKEPDVNRNIRRRRRRKLGI